LRAALDLLAFNLASVYTVPLSDDVAESSEFPIFGDEDRQGNTGVGATRFNSASNAGIPNRGSGLYKIRGVNPGAQTIIEALRACRDLRGNSNEA